MMPHLEEAWRSLRLADRDVQAFDILRESEAHATVVCFHAQQAVEKSLKAVLLSQRIEFERTHDLVSLARLLDEHEAVVPVEQDRLRLLNPFAVAFRYDDLDVAFVSYQDAASLVADVRCWAEAQLRAATDSEQVDCL